jgi:hypothetical protein
MRPFVLGGVLSVAVLLPKVGNAQVYQFRTPPPPVTAEFAEWQFNGEAMPFAGLIYFPTRETRFFDGQLMAQVGHFRNVPVYADVTLEPHSVVYVPIGRNLVRAYERRRDRELAGTEGSRPSAFPLVSPSETLREPQLLGTTGSAAPSVAREASAPAAPNTAVARTRVESVPRPSGINGVWLVFNGSRWYSDGSATALNAERFMKIGEYRGFPVYREKSEPNDRIWVTTLPEGPIAPYIKR